MGLVTLTGLLACTTCQKERNQLRLLQAPWSVMAIALNHSLIGRKQKALAALF